MRTITMILFAALLAASCGKETPATCEAENTGQICITNSYEERVGVSINSVGQGFIAPGRTECYDMAPGTYSVRLAEADAVLFPDEWSFTQAVAQCDRIQKTIQ